jgi:hypothetical protein
MIDEIVQSMPEVVSNWGLGHLAGNDPSSRNLRSVLLGVGPFACAIYTPITNPGLALCMMLLGAVLCSRPLYLEIRRMRFEKAEDAG